MTIFLSLLFNLSFSQTDTGVTKREWYFVGSSGDNDFYVKSETVSVMKRIGWVKVWVKMLAPNDVVIKSLMEFSCTTKSSKIKRVVKYFKSKVVSDTEDETADFIDVIPESIGEKLLNWVCQVFI